VTGLPRDLDQARRQIEAYARQYGLDFYDVVFEMLDYDQLNEVAAFGGFPTRYPHWRFGMEYEELSKSYSYGLSKIYELVINNNPVYAYLMKANAPVEQKLVMAHVFGHADFFKNNLWFSKTNRRMVDAMANHATRVRHHIDRHGIEAVEDFIDACLSLENLIDYHAPFVERRREAKGKAHADEEEDGAKLVRLPSKPYMEPYINPPSFLEQQKTKRAERAKRKRQVPSEPERDVLKFLLDHAPLESWEHDVLSIVREEAYYFAPQGMTKTLNEGWACIGRNSRVFTDRGLITIADLVDGDAGCVYDGRRKQRVYDRHVIRDHATVRIVTRRGLTLEGSTNHRVLLADGVWRRLDRLQCGDRVSVSGGGSTWAKAHVSIDWVPAPRRIGLADVAAGAGVSYSTVMRYVAGSRAASSAAIDEALLPHVDAVNQALPWPGNARARIRIPRRVDSTLASFLGYLVGDGHISRVKRNLGLTSGDEEQALAFFRLGQRLFGLPARIEKDGGRWRVLFHSQNLADFLVEACGLQTGPSARRKSIPEVVLRSPEPVVRAFLRAYFDCDAHAGPAGVILSTASTQLADQVQMLLLNYGILSTRGRQAHDCWHVRVMGASAKRFAEKIGFGLSRKHKALQAYITSHRWFPKESWNDEVVSIERGRADVYDISVEQTHRYAAQGFINHNSYWHSTIMTQKALRASELVDYADQHSGTLAMTPGRMNPYKIGMELFREIEDRWNKGKFGKEYDECDDIEARRRWDRRLGLGRQKIFEVRKIYNDVMFIDAFMDQEFCERLQLYVYGYDTRSGRYVVVDRDWRKVKERFLFSLTNLGQPIVHVQDANYGNRGELYLVHKFEGVPLDMDKARDTLKNLHRLWRRPVHLETVEDERGRLLSYDGSEHKNVRL
jgi:stage V sporulation protein R